jgi:hypothetical protein
LSIEDTKMALLSNLKRILGWTGDGVHKRISNVKRILGWVGGGVHKRIDENRELLELLQREAPEFLASHWWVEGWLASNDEFFSALASSVPITEGLFLGQAKRQPTEFPRPWPGKR